MRSLFRGDNLIALFLLGVVGVYLWDTLQASLALANVMFVLPVSVLAGGLGIAILVKQNLPRPPPADTAPADTAQAAPADDGQEASALPRAVGMLALFGGLILGMLWLPFDLASWLFLLAGLLWLGERRKLFLLFYPLLVGFLTTLAFRLLLPYPMETLL